MTENTCPICGTTGSHQCVTYFSEMPRWNDLIDRLERIAVALEALAGKGELKDVYYRHARPEGLSKEEERRVCYTGDAAAGDTTTGSGVRE